MKQTYYLIDIYIRYQIAFGIRLSKHINGYHYHAIIIEVLCFSFNINFNRPNDKFINFYNLL